MGAASASTAADSRGVLDPAFRRVPFDQWVAKSEPAQIHWSVNVSKARLSSHQRLQTKIEALVDDRELAKRRGKGGLVMLVQFKDSDGRRYQSHAAMDLRDMKDPGRGAEAVFSLDALVTPGSYGITTVIFDPATGEHSVVQRTLRVDALGNDPLPDAWKDLPPVELLSVAEPPDAWFLPRITGRLHLPIGANRPVRVDLLMNASPSDDGDGPKVGIAANWNLGVLVPAMKALSQLDAGDGSVNIAVLDLMRRQIPFEQKMEGNLDWPRLKAAIEEANPNVIDVHALQNREQNAQFFVTEVARRISAASAALESDTGEPFRVVIVLSAPMAFHSGADMHPITVAAPRNCRVFYIRYHAYAPVVLPRMPEDFGTPRGLARSRRAGSPSPVPPGAGAHEPADSLERTLRPLQPQLFDVVTPEEFRKALGKMLEEISRM